MGLFSYNFFFFNWEIKIPKTFVKLIMKHKKQWRKKKRNNGFLLLWGFEIHVVQISIFSYQIDRGQVVVLLSLILKEISQHWNAPKINVL